MVSDIPSSVAFEHCFRKGKLRTSTKDEFESKHIQESTAVSIHSQIRTDAINLENVSEECLNCDTSAKMLHSDHVLAIISTENICCGFQCFPHSVVNEYLTQLGSWTGCNTV